MHDAYLITFCPIMMHPLPSLLSLNVCCLAGLLGLTKARDSFLTNLCRFALPAELREQVRALFSFLFCWLFVPLPPPLPSRVFFSFVLFPLFFFFFALFVSFSFFSLFFPLVYSAYSLVPFRVPNILSISIYSCILSLSIHLSIYLSASTYLSISPLYLFFLFFCFVRCCVQ